MKQVVTPIALLRYLVEKKNSVHILVRDHDDIPPEERAAIEKEEQANCDTVKRGYDAEIQAFLGQALLEEVYSL